MGSDGSTTWSDADPPHPTRQGHAPWELIPVFPLRAPVWGRMADDYFPVSARSDARGIRLVLDGTEDDRSGELLVDDHGFLLEVDLDGSRLELHDLVLSPQPDRLFVRT